MKKRTSHLDWEDLRYFVALARHASLSAAARRLRVNHATVARRVESLEQTLGRVLFDRRPTGYTLTQAGRAILDQATAMEESAIAIRQPLVAARGLSGTVRLTATRVLADGFLIDRLGGLREKHPGLDLELMARSRLVSIGRREADIAIRFGQPKDSALIARRVGRIAFGLYASRGTRDRLAVEPSPPLIGFDDDSAFVAEAAWLAERFAERRFAFRSNSQTAQALAARAGFGVALLPCYLAAKDRRLVAIADGELPPPREVWLLMRRDVARLPRVRAVADYLVAVFRKERSLLAGG